MYESQVEYGDSRDAARHVAGRAQIELVEGKWRMAHARRTPPITNALSD